MIEQAELLRIAVDVIANSELNYTAYNHMYPYLYDLLIEAQRQALALQKEDDQMALALSPQRTTTDAPAVFGSRDEIKAIADRISVMLPSARLQDYQLKRDDRDRLQKILDESIYRAAQLCVFYRLVPGEDVHVIPFGADSWAVDMGIETWKKAADRYCALNHVTYHIVTEPMPLDELKARRGPNYDPDDVGMVAWLWRSDKEGAYRIFGPEKAMTKAYGIWAKKAKQDSKGNWKADQVPAQRSKQDVAKRRAMKAVLKLEFSLDSLLAANPQELREHVQAVTSQIHSAEITQAPYAPRQYAIDDNGFIVDAEPVEAEYIDAEPPSVDDVDFYHDADAIPEPSEPDVPNPFDGPSDPVTVAYDAIGAKLEGDLGTFRQWARSVHLNSEPSSVAQYRFLAGELDRLIGKKNHNLFLGVLIGRDVNSSNVPGWKLVKNLLDAIRLQDTIEDENGKKVKVENPHFRQDVADKVVAIWKIIEADITAV